MKEAKHTHTHTHKAGLKFNIKKTKIMASDPKKKKEKENTLGQEKVLQGQGQQKQMEVLGHRVWIGFRPQPFSDSRGQTNHLWVC